MKTEPARTKEVSPLYQKIAAWFDGARDKTLFEEKYLAQISAAIPSNGHILDLGCGSGEPIAKFFIEHGHQITGVDLTPAMIDMCKQRFPAHSWHVGDMRTFSLDEKFDAILAWDSFFHLDHAAQRGMFPVFKAHAKPGALLLLNTGTSHGEVYGTMQGLEFYHSSLTPEEYHALFAQNGFDVLSFTPDQKDCGGRTVWLAQYNPKETANAL